jgi:hypothetical protein
MHAAQPDVSCCESNKKTFTLNVIKTKDRLLFTTHPLLPTTLSPAPTCILLCIDVILSPLLQRTNSARARVIMMFFIGRRRSAQKHVLSNTSGFRRESAELLHFYVCHERYGAC